MKQAPGTRKIRLEAAIGGFFLSVMLIFAAAYGVFRNIAGDMRDIRVNDLLTITDLKRFQIEDHLSDLRADAELLAQQPELRTLLDPRTPAATLESARNTLHKRIGFIEQKKYQKLQVVITDARLQPVVNQDADSPAQAMGVLAKGELPPALRATAAAAFQDRQVRLLDLHRDPNQTVRYGMAGPVFADEARPAAPIGVVLMELDASSTLFRLLDSSHLRGETTESVMVRKENERLRFLNPLRNSPKIPPLTLTLPADTPRLGAAMAIIDPDKVREGVDYRGVPVIGAATAISGTPWYFLTKIDQSESDAPIATLAWTTGGLAAAFILMTGLLAYFLWRTGDQATKLQQTLLSRRHSRAIETSIDGFFRFNAEGHIIETNAALCRLTGYDAAELAGMTIYQVEGQMSAQEIDAKLIEIRAADGMRFPTRWRCRDASLVDVEVSVIYNEDSDGGFYYGYLHDITAFLLMEQRLRRLNEYQSFLARVTAAIFQLREPQAILDTFCRAAVTEGGFLLSWAGVPDESSGKVSVAAAAGEAADYARTITVTTDPDLPTSQGPTGLCIREQRPMLANDFMHEVRTSPWHDIAQRYGLRSSAAVPVMVDGKTLAALMFYSGDAGYFEPDIVELLVETARNVSLAWESGLNARERDLEHDLRERLELHYQNIFDASPLPIQIHELGTGSLIAINQAHRATFGYAPEEIASAELWFTRVYPDPAFRENIRTVWQQDLERARLTGGTAYSPEIGLRCKDGSERILSGAMKISGENIILTWSDLTELRRNEAALHESESRFLATFEQAAVGMALVSPQGRFLKVNQRLSDFLGYGPDELLARSFQELTYPDDLELDLSNMHSLLDGKISTYAIEKRYIRRDGEVIWVNLTVSLMRRSDGQPDYFISIIEDIQVRKQAELDLQQSEERFRGLIEQTVAGFYVVRDDRFVYVNPQFERMLGWSATELLGHDPQEFLEPESMPVLLDAHTRIRKGPRIIRANAQWRHCNGSKRILGLHSSPGLWEERDATIVMAEDVTEHEQHLKEIGEYMERLERSMKGTLEAVARMVDLRDPYTAGHERRVGLIAADLAREMGWDAPRANSLEMIGLVHDIGKIAVPAELLSKPTRLSKTEYEMIKMHAQAGYDILKDVPFEQPVAEIIRQHHERMDGSGYPQGLKGEQIMPEARVLAVADVVESMASHRPYRPALGIDKALEEIERNRDTLYDGEVVAAALRLVREKNYKLPD